MVEPACGRCNFQGDSRSGKTSSEILCLIDGNWHEELYSCKHWVEYAYHLSRPERVQLAIARKNEDDAERRHREALERIERHSSIHINVNQTQHQTQSQNQTQAQQQATRALSHPPEQKPELWKRFGKWLLALVGIVITAWVLDLFGPQAQLPTKQVASPRLSLRTDFRPAYVGPARGRIDEVVCVPVGIYNNSDAFALDPQFDILMNYTSWAKPTSLKQYQTDQKMPTSGMSRLERGAKWESSPNELCLSVVSNAAQIYQQGTQQCQIEINLEWLDAARKKYRLVHFAQLTYAEPAENTQGYFWFRPVAQYDTLSGPDSLSQVHRHWGLPIDWPEK